MHANKQLPVNVFPDLKCYLRLTFGRLNEMTFN